MILKHYLFQLICFLLLTMEPLLLAAAPITAKPGCKNTCGNNVTIPYPFGIATPNCFIDKWYEVICRHDKPYLSKFYGQEFGGEVLNISIRESTITINANNTVIRLCEDKGMWLARNLSGSPFVYNNNILNFIGCGNIMVFQNQMEILGGCASTCDRSRNISSCLGINCCSYTITYVQQIYLNLSNFLNGSNSCGYAIFGNNPTISTYLLDPSENLLGVTNPIDLRWSVSGKIPTPLPNNTECKFYDDRYNTGYNCYCVNGGEGNPYIANECPAAVDIPNVASTPPPSSYNPISTNIVIIVFSGCVFGVVFFGTITFWVHKLISKIREKRRKENSFIRNGGLLLQQQMSVDKNMINKVRLFTSIELDKATDNFNESRILGRGGQGTVYKGILDDGKIVAVKMSKVDDQKQVEQFINEVVLLSQINQRNVVKLFGCCLETHVPLLVYEFISNGTLYDLMHNEDDEFLMSWETRLRIATEIGGALAYLHSATSFPIYHRDVKSSNILLDEKHIAKLSDFGISRHVSVDQTHLTTMVKGTFGYLDPEYFQSNQFTDKSDVYSYGVVLVELLTRRKPISSPDNTDECCSSLATQFLISMEEDRLNKILDTEILETASDEQVTAIAILAQRCLSLDGRTRPTMKEVAIELQNLKISQVPLAIQASFEGERRTGVELAFISNGSTSSSWTTTNDTGVSS